MTPGTATHGHVTLLTWFLSTDRGRIHCRADRFTRLFHLRRLWISFTEQTHVQSYAPFSYSMRAVKRDNINHKR